MWLVLLCVTALLMKLMVLRAVLSAQVPKTWRLGLMTNDAMHCCSANEVNSHPSSIVCSLNGLLVWVVTAFGWLLICHRYWWESCLLPWKGSTEEIKPEKNSTVKQEGIKYHFLSLWYDSTWAWSLVSQTISEHSNHLNQNTQTSIRPSLDKGEEF